MKRFIDTIYDNLREFNNPLDGIGKETSIPVTKEVPQSDTVTSTKISHIAQQKERLVGELDAGVAAAKEHMESGNYKLARLALESLEKLEEEIRGLELEHAGVQDKTANSAGE